MDELNSIKTPPKFCVVNSDDNNVAYIVPLKESWGQWNSVWLNEWINVSDSTNSDKNKNPNNGNDKSIYRYIFKYHESTELVNVKTDIQSYDPVIADTDYNSDDHSSADEAEIKDPTYFAIETENENHDYGIDVSNTVQKMMDFVLVL